MKIKEYFSDSLEEYINERWGWAGIRIDNSGNQYNDPAICYKDDILTTFFWRTVEKEFVSYWERGKPEQSPLIQRINKYIKEKTGLNQRKNPAYKTRQALIKLWRKNARRCNQPLDF